MLYSIDGASISCQGDAHHTLNTRTQQDCTIQIHKLPAYLSTHRSSLDCQANLPTKINENMTEPAGGLSAQVGELKEEGNRFFRAAEYLKAAAAYTKAIKLAGKDGSNE